MGTWWSSCTSTSRPFASVRFVYGRSMRVTQDPTGKEVHTSTATRMLVVLAAAEFLGMTAWFSATAATPALIAEFDLDSSGASWLTMAVQAGVVGGAALGAPGELPGILHPP